FKALLQAQEQSIAAKQLQDAPQLRKQLLGLIQDRQGKKHAASTRKYLPRLDEVTQEATQRAQRFDTAHVAYRTADALVRSRTDQGLMVISESDHGVGSLKVDFEV
ncbi:MAG: hypothetical protein JKY27_04565, partial [Magnetovibrio sp.]|nr:hypothetical protein [Magnetovibrio sp.]